MKTIVTAHPKIGFQVDVAFTEGLDRDAQVAAILAATAEIQKIVKRPPPRMSSIVGESILSGPGYKGKLTWWEKPPTS